MNCEYDNAIQKPFIGRHRLEETTGSYPQVLRLAVFSGRFSKPILIKGIFNMRWFKHLTHSSRDEKLAQVIELLGLEGYGVYWRILEIIAENLDEKCQTSITYTDKQWANFLRTRRDKLENIFRTFELLQLFFFKR